jgi:hypothetical protein
MERAVRSSPTFQTAVLGENLRGAGIQWAEIPRYKVDDEQAKRAKTTGCRTLAESGSESKLRSESDTIGTS